MQLDRTLLDRIAAAHGPSFYLLDTHRFRENFTGLLGAFKAHYPDTAIAYSYKTNYIPRFCRIVDELGGFAEVVSSMEQKVALRAGIPAEKIYFNGPFKERPAIAEVLLGGGVVNADSLEEVDTIVQIALSHPEQTLRVGLRCNFDVGDGVLSRFGFDVEANDFRKARQRIEGTPNLRLVGLHCHFATRSLACWEGRTLGMLRLLDGFLADARAPLQFVSLGGGMYGNMPPELAAQFPVAIPEFADYARVAAGPFARFFAERPHYRAPTLIIEPGTALVADAMKFVAQVVSIKDVRGKTIASLAGSTYNVNPNPNRKNVPIEVFPPVGGGGGDREPRLDVDFGGYTCIEGDYLYRGYDGALEVGDFVTFDDVGSYSVVMKPPFILPNVAIIEVDEDADELRVIKRRERFDDLFATYEF